MPHNNIILGAGMSGLAAGHASGFPIYEAADIPGGICSSYYIKPYTSERIVKTPAENDEVYRFELGGGHWIFGEEPEVLSFLESFVPMKGYSRISGVFLNKQSKYIPYPLQYHLRFLDKSIRERVIKEISLEKGSSHIMKKWLQKSFGLTLCDMFFFPFHDLYTSGLYDRIAPQDSYKSPVKVDLVIKGASDNVEQAGYNVTFRYPEGGLNKLAERISLNCHINYGKKAVKIDLSQKRVYFDDSSSEVYENLISTLPLNRIMKMADINLSSKPDPFTSVLVLNIGATVGSNCPDYHWLYTPAAKSGFHRVGFYSNVDPDFLPESSREDRSRVSLYIEKAFPGGKTPSRNEINWYTKNVIDELREWGFIENIEVIDPTWIDVAYTWKWPESAWVQAAIDNLRQHDITQLGRYGKWSFQGIVESIHEGLVQGSALK